MIKRNHSSNGSLESGKFQKVNVVPIDAAKQGQHCQVPENSVLSAEINEYVKLQDMV